MRFAIISDIHSNLEALQAVLARIDSLGADEIICLGDITGYNANPNECIDLVRARGIKCILGNHDAASATLEDPWFFTSAAKDAVLWTRKHISEENREFLRSLPEEIIFNGQWLAVHGSPLSRDQYLVDWFDMVSHVGYMQKRNLTLCVFGHTHRPAFVAANGNHQPVPLHSVYPLNSDEIYFINPGAVGQARDKDPRAGFAILDSANPQVEFYRVDYDREVAADKIAPAGLPAKLAHRILFGY